MTVDIYIDSDVIVSSEIEDEKYHEESKIFMDFVLRNHHLHIKFYVSVFTFLELASAMIRRTGNKDKVYSLLYRLRTSWKQSIKPLAPIPPEEMTSFTRLVDTLVETSVSYHTPSGDTIHAQTVVTYGMDYLVTWNKKHFTYIQGHMKNLKILNPTEALAELKGKY